jgi:predicted RNase H-like nuclease (RuvC/YqgF family)
MNRDDIIKMAHAAECVDNKYPFSDTLIAFLERFAALVAAHEIDLERESRQEAQNQLYAERERHTSSVKALESEVGRLTAENKALHQSIEFANCLAQTLRAEIDQLRGNL